MVNRIVSFFTSLRLTVVCLSLALLLVFIGTLAQVDQGLYVAQNRYFRSLLVYWSPKGADWRIPVFPGGYLLGGFLLVNLIAAHIKRFTFSKKKIGIFLIHAGLILLLLGQFATDLLQVETHMRLSEGEAKNYSESDRVNELVLINSASADRDQVVAISGNDLERGKQIRHRLPFTIQVKDYIQTHASAGARP
jgi:cytochrome c biogenesis factor